MKDYNLKNLINESKLHFHHLTSQLPANKQGRKNIIKEKKSHIPVPKFRSHGEKLFGWWVGVMKPKKRMMLNTRFPKVFARSVANHVKTYKILHWLILKYKNVNKITGTVINKYIFIT